MPRKNDKIKCDLERDNISLNNKLIGIITVFGSMTVFLLALFDKDSYVTHWITNRFKDFELFTFSLNATIFYAIACVALLCVFLYHKYRVGKRADDLNRNFINNNLKIGQIAGVKREELQHYKETEK